MAGTPTPPSSAEVLTSTFSVPSPQSDSVDISLPNHTELSERVVAIVGKGNNNLTPEEIRAVNLLLEALILLNCSVLTGDYPGVDQRVQETWLARSSDINIRSSLYVAYKEDIPPALKGLTGSPSNVHALPYSTNSEFLDIVFSRCCAVVVIGGYEQRSGFPVRMYNEAKSKAIDIPFIPIAWTGGCAMRIFKRLWPDQAAESGTRH